MTRASRLPSWQPSLSSAARAASARPPAPPIACRSSAARHRGAPFSSPPIPPRRSPAALGAPSARTRAGRAGAARLSARQRRRGRRAFERWLAPRSELLVGDRAPRHLSRRRGRGAAAEAVAAGHRRSDRPARSRAAGGETSFDAVVVDTAPTGHTLRLLAAPVLLGRVAGVLDGLQSHHRAVVERAARIVPRRRRRHVHRRSAARRRALAAMLRDRTATRDHVGDAARADGARGNRRRDRGAERPRDATRRRDRQPARRRRTIVPVVRRAPSVRGAGARAARAPAAGSRLLGLPEFGAEPRGPASLAKVASSLRPLVPGPRPAPPAHRVIARLTEGTPAAASALVPAVRWLLFGGKGGVGKSTCAAAYAIDLALADPARRVLLISTDPAHSLGDVLGHRVDDEPRSVPGGPAGLHVREIDVAACHAPLQGTLPRRDGGSRRTVRAIRTMPDTQHAVRQLMDLAPPGIDEVMAIAEVRICRGSCGPLRHDRHRHGADRPRAAAPADPGAAARSGRRR